MKRIFFITIFILASFLLSGCNTPETLSTPELISPPNQAGSTQTFQGIGYPEATVLFYLNDILVESTQINDDGTFEETLSFDAEGEQQLTIKQTFKEVSSEISTPYNFVTDLTAPPSELSITSSIPDYTSTSPLIITGITDPSNTVKINGFYEPTMNENGSFSYELSLKSGKNLFRIYLEDEVGNRTDDIIDETILFDDTPTSYTGGCLPSYMFDPDITDVKEFVCLSVGSFSGPYSGTAYGPVTGKVLGNVESVKVNNTYISWKEDGTVNQRVPFYVYQGTNNFDVVIYDKAGNITEGTLSISWGTEESMQQSELEDRLDDLESMIEDLE